VKVASFFLFTFLLTVQLNAQQLDSIVPTKDTLNNVVVTAFYNNTNWKDAPVPISSLSQKKLQQFSASSLVPIINTIAGVRMEERSPGSYRFSIRGSLLRSPFGVRNVKVYYNGLPLSDGGGNTYLNLVELNTLTSVEILKGPASSVYGANTGGALLLKSELPFTTKKQNSFIAGLSGGSYNMLQQNITWQQQQKNSSLQLQQSHQQSSGYREQSAMRKDVLQFSGTTQFKKQQMHFLLFYTDLFYQIPGGLTLAQLNTNATWARQATATLPSAVQQQTAVYNKTLFTGVQHSYTINNAFATQVGANASATWFANPFITNYEKRKEINVGFTARFVYKHKFVQWITGVEWLNNNSSIDNYGNKQGLQDTLQYKDKVFANQWFGYSQLQLTVSKVNIAVGVSINQQLYSYKRLSSATPSNFLHSSSNIVAAPRVTFLYKLAKNISTYAIVSKGFSPPSLAEVHPSDGNFYSSLQPEFGYNYEVGIKGYANSNRLQFDASAYYFSLQKAIVKRNNADGSEYFVNAGNTKQKGVELWWQYHIIENKKHFLSALTFYNSNSFQPYKFSNYSVGTTDYTGNALTGVPEKIVVVGIEAETKSKLMLNVIFNYTSSLPLNDANTDFVSDYKLLQAKLSYHFMLHQIKINVFAGADNLLNESYSLGNDINAAGKRYYNAAPTLNFFAGIKLHW
jgi:iron complex outermembrane recepter protein